jgi:hypothetical protein
MKKNRNLNACMSILHDIQRRDDIDPKQKKAACDAICLIKRFRRLEAPSRAETYAFVFKISRLLAESFLTH